MPAGSNITIKKNDGTTDIQWTFVTPSSGDRSAAVWQSQTVGSALAHRPTFSLTARDNGPGTGRRFDWRMQYPQIATNTTTGVTSVVQKAVADGSFLIPKDMATTDTFEAISQCFHLLATTLMKDHFKSGYSAT